MTTTAVRSSTQLQRTNRHDADKFKMLRNLNADPRLFGCETQLVPLLQFISSQRLTMFSSQSVQAVIPRGCEMPLVASGYEREFEKYTFDCTTFETDAHIIEAIPKYRTGVGSQPIKASPSFTVVYIGEDNLVHVMEVPTYVKGIEGFGYDMEVDYSLLGADTLVKKGTSISHSPAVQGSKYCLGLNANICYMTSKDTVEDAISISTSLAKALESVGIKTQQVAIDKNMIPVNTYGTMDSYKFMPDIHEQIRDDAILCAFRHVNDVSIMTDMTDESLMQPQYAHDDVYFADSNDGVVIDIDVFRNPSPKTKTPSYMFEQLEKYENASINYYTRIITLYKKYCVVGSYKLAPEFNSLVTRAAGILEAYHKRTFLSRKTPPKFSRKGSIIELIDLVITYRYINKVTEGNKLSGREGAKGVISTITPDIHMPINDFGVRADAVIASASPVNRMNLSQSYEQFLNCMSQAVIRDMGDMSIDDAYNYFLDYLDDVNPCYMEVVANVVGDSSVKKEALVTKILKEEKIILCIPSYLNTLTPEWVLKMRDKYHVVATPISYDMLDFDGKVIRRVRTIRPIWIGRRYTYILCKIPHARACGMSYVNQWETPLKIKSAKFKSMYPIGLTPIRFGEDETRQLIMMIGSRLAFRILSLYANSPEATANLCEELLTAEYPTQLTWSNVTDEQLRKSNNMIKVFKHMTTTIGVDFDSPIATQEELDDLRAFEQSLA